MPPPPLPPSIASSLWAAATLAADRRMGTAQRIVDAAAATGHGAGADPRRGCHVGPAAHRPRVRLRRRPRATRRDGGVGLGYHHSASPTSKSTTRGPIACRRPDAIGGAPMAAPAAGDLRSEFREVILSRRREHQVPVPTTVEQGSPVKEPMYQGNGPPGGREAMESCPRKEVENFEEKLVEENFYLMTELERDVVDAPGRCEGAELHSQPY
ncbi:hypothetical protein ACQJBY_042852 [Aegilops geniculata]